MDKKDWILLEGLQNDGRVSFAELGRLAGMSAPAAAERVRRMEDAGIITGYRAEVDPAKLGRPLQVIIRLSVPNKDYPRFRRFLAGAPEIMECLHVSGDAAVVLRAAVADVPALEDLIRRLSPYGQTATSLVLSTFLHRRTVAG
ncbi:MAG TPA: Lrp/AsnC ligand binding domain-containing protein [Bryobacteraceae bacterium]|nr:Lrp/AsnC ligand binding domain-containing protein [Bryobacteraceae bacterium]